MKTSFSKILSMLLALTMLLSMTGMTAFAVKSEPLPTTLEAPSLLVYDSGSYTMDIEVKYLNPISIMDIYEKGYTNRGYDEESYSYFSDYGDYSLYNASIQFDWKIDDGEWQYTTDWDDSYFAGDYYSSIGGQRVSHVEMGYITSYYSDDLGQALLDQGCLIETTDGSSTYYRFDTANHTLSVRARYFFTFANGSYSDMPKVFSDWSSVATYGVGNIPENNVPMSLSAPTISNLEIYDTSSYGYPCVRFDSYPAEDVVSAMMWAEQYNSSLEDSSMHLLLEASTDPNFGDGATVIKRTVYEGSSLKRKIQWDDMFYDLWYELPSSDQEAFVWNGETVYVRAKWVNEREISGQSSKIESPYSNVLSVTGPTVTSYTVTVTHGDYGFDSTYEDNENVYQITEGRRYYSVYCYPLEGCYVDTVTVNGAVMYDHDDETTHELLDWWSNYTAFDFIDDAQYATQDLDIDITYAGTPTAMYGITTEWGDGGYLYSGTDYVSWNDNSLVVYHSTEPKLYIDPYDGFVIDTVLIDGVENAEAKANGYYTFPAITDNSHSIEVTFKREAYHVDFWWDSNGTVQTDYEWWNGQTEYVKIGDDITFTITPDQDAHGNYYEIENVYVDYVVNEEAKATGTYTFTNVQANHDFSVNFSDDPVITHDVTASSGENGNISPEGVVHVREGSTKTFYFYPDDGYEVDKVIVDGVEITNLATKEYYNIANVTAEHTIHVTFKKLPVQYDVNVLVSGHNTSAHSVSPRGVTPVWEGESFTVTFAPFAGYQVEKVLVNNSVVTADGTYTIASVSADTTIEIFFKIKSYTVTFVDHDGTELKKETVEHGAQATAPAAPSREHYVFTGWDTTFSDVTTNVTIRATYKPAEYTVKFIGWDGTVLKTETVTYTGNATAPEAPAREGYDFDRWNHSFTNVSENLEVTAIYTQKEYVVTFVDSDDTVLSTQNVKHGEAATAPANPTKEGYTFVGWDNTGYGHVTQAMTIKAMYMEGTCVTYTVTARALGDSGAVSPAGVTTVQENGSLVLNFTPTELTKIVKVVVDGVEIELCNSYTFKNITANHIIDVYFAPTAIIGVMSDNNEHGTASGHYALIDDEMVYILDIDPADGYELDGIYVDGVKIGIELTVDGYVFRDLDEDVDLEVRFKLVTDGTQETPESEKIPTTPMYRLYNPNTGEHFYTGSTVERDMLVEVGWHYEGVAWNAPIYSGTPVFRVYNPNSGDHHYTMSQEEVDMLVELGWQYEGVAWNSAPANHPEAIPLYRLYNPNADCGSHHYTGSVEEREFLVSLGWIFEGIGWFGLLK